MDKNDNKRAHDDPSLARWGIGNRFATKTEASLIIAWHLTVLPGTVILANWVGWLRNNVTPLAGGVPASAPRIVSNMDGDFFSSMFSSLVFSATLFLGILTIEGLFGWLLFRLRVQRCEPSVALSLRLFIRYWWRLCRLGVVLLPAASILFTGLSPSRDAAINFPLFWVPLGVIAPTVLVSIDLQRWRRTGNCRVCGYNLTGNVSGRCPECGTEINGSPRAPQRFEDHQ